MTFSSGLVCGLLLFLVFTVSAETAGSEQKIRFNIPPQRADLSLTAFAKQARLTLIVPFDLVRTKTTNRLEGEYGVKEAIRILLQGTGLEAHVGDDNQLSISVGQPSGGTQTMNKKADRSAGILALFGRNATGGLIHYISRKPTDEFEAYGSVSYAEYDHVRFEGAAGGPLTDSLQLRISGFVNNHDPFVDNIGTGNDGNEADTWAVRGQATFTPTDSWSVFGQVEWDFTEALTVIAGLRYLNEEKEMDARGSIAGFLAGLPIPRIYGTLNPDNSPNARVEEEDVAGKIQLN